MDPVEDFLLSVDGTGCQARLGNLTLLGDFDYLNDFDLVDLAFLNNLHFWLYLLPNLLTALGRPL